MRRNTSSMTSFSFTSNPAQTIDDLSTIVESDVLEFYKHFLEVSSSLDAEVDDVQVLEENKEKFAVITHFSLFLTRL